MKKLLSFLGLPQPIQSEFSRLLNPSKPNGYNRKRFLSFMEKLFSFFTSRIKYILVFVLIIVAMNLFISIVFLITVINLGI